MDQNAGKKVIEFQSLDIFALEYLIRLILNFVFPEFYYKIFQIHKTVERILHLNSHLSSKFIMNI